MGFGGVETPDTSAEQLQQLLYLQQLQQWQQLQAASVAPLTTDEKALYTRTGKRCCWADSGEYAFRLRQLTIINHAIKRMSEELWKDAELISNFQRLHRSIITYTDVEGNPIPNHEWTLLAEDPTFKPMELPMNRFKEFEQYFTTRGGATRQQMKTDFENYMTIFIRIRSELLKLMARQCENQQISQS
jgi:hypothetical protein